MCYLEKSNWEKMASGTSSPNVNLCYCNHFNPLSDDELEGTCNVSSSIMKLVGMAPN